MFTSISLIPQQGSAPYPGPDHGGRFVPAQHGAYYLYLGPAPVNRFVRGNRPNQRPAPAPLREIAVYKFGMTRPVLRVANVPVPNTDEQWFKHDFTFDKRFHLIPQAKVLIVIPPSNDQLILHRVDLEAELEKMTKK
jgi:hypothetical protein